MLKDKAAKQRRQETAARLGGRVVKKWNEDIHNSVNSYVITGACINRLPPAIFSSTSEFSQVQQSAGVEMTLHRSAHVPCVCDHLVSSVNGRPHL
jgi:hypothetical protein